MTTQHDYKAKRMQFGLRELLAVLGIAAVLFWLLVQRLWTRGYVQEKIQEGNSGRRIALKCFCAYRCGDVWSFHDLQKMNGLCPHCREDVAVDGEILAGDIVDCPSCGQSIEIPPPPRLKSLPSVNAVKVAAVVFIVNAMLIGTLCGVSSSLGDDHWLQNWLGRALAVELLLLFPQSWTVIRLLNRSRERRAEDESDLVYWLPRQSTLSRDGD